MDFLTFVSKTFEAWAWPLTVLAIVGWFKDELKDLIPNIESIKAAGVEATVNRKMRAASAFADDLPPVQPPAEHAPPEYDVTIKHPEFAIVEAWKEVEHFTNEYAALRSDKPAKKRIVSTPELKSLGLTEAEANLYRELLQVRNLVVHERKANVSPEQAREYVDLAYRLVGLIRIKTDLERGRRSPV